MANVNTEMIDKEVFDTFFRENYCELEYAQVKAEFEQVLENGLEEIFIDETDFSKVTEKNFIIYLKSVAYGEFEAIVEEAFDSLNPEITDAVMDVSISMEEQDAVTGIYWDTQEKLLKDFLHILFKDRIATMIAAV